MSNNVILSFIIPTSKISSHQLYQKIIDDTKIKKIFTILV